MFLPQRFNKFAPPQFIGTVAGAVNSPILGTTQKWPIPRTWPIEDILIRVNFVVNAGGLTLVTNPQTPDQYDNILQLLQHVNLQTNDGKQPRSVVDCSGIALLEYQEHGGENVDISTRNIMALCQLPILPAGNYTLTYRIPCVDDSVAEPLRSRLYLPIHTYPQDPVLTLNFQAANAIYTAGNINSIMVDVLVVGRQVTPQSEMALQKSAGTNPNGYIDWDLIETPFLIPVGSAAAQRFALPLPGSYTNLQFRHYLGGANIARKEIDNGAIGSSFGNENRWDIETAANAIREWNWPQLRILSEMSQAVCPFMQGQPGVALGGLFAAPTSAGSPTVQLAAMINQLMPLAGGGIPAGQSFRYSNSVWMDFLSDGKSQENAKELGSVLDCNTPANTGLKMEIVGTPTNVATNASQLLVMGRRFFGDLSNWQKFG